MTHEHTRADWERTAARRRLIFLALLFIPSFIACGFMARALSPRSSPVLESLLVISFGVLYIWISFGFWMSAAGVYTLMRRYDQFTMTGEAEDEKISMPGGASTAILIPVRNEKVDRTFAGLYATYKSLQQTGYIDRFHFFILSDTDDPDKWVEEEAAWDDLCKAVKGRGRIFYRNRRVNIKRKSGNIADFCRRWGSGYRYMTVFDADSIMSGSALVQMVSAMERNPHVGILQTSPRPVNAKTLFARLQQFANHLYGPVFSAGLHFWQLGDAQYWGHNAIIRVKPFMKHCALPVLPGNPPMGGYILSHDFVEAALIRKAGWGVWLAHELGGSYEELPPTLEDDLGRDRRWCQGNLQHLRLLFTKRLFPAHRALFLVGAMAYISGFLWLLFLAAGTAQAFFEALAVNTYFHSSHSLFPDWPVCKPGWTIALLTSTALLLFSPKFLSVLIVLVKQRRAHQFGGRLKLLLSVAAEILFSTLFAPVKMLFHSKFVLLTLLGYPVKWDPQEREERAVSWRNAFRVYGSGVVFGLAWGAPVFLVSPFFFWWVTPVLTALVFSVPLSVWSGRSTAGERFRRLGLFLTPNETAPDRQIFWLNHYISEYRLNKNLNFYLKIPLAIEKEKGFVRAVIDPRVNALHLLLLRGGRRYCQSILERQNALRQKALLAGPDRLSASEKKELLSDPRSMAALRNSVWKSLYEPQAGKWWTGVLRKTFHHFL